jgi:hypothetical protein
MAPFFTTLEIKTYFISILNERLLDSMPYVRAALASSVCDLVHYLDNNDIIYSLLPLLTKLLKDPQAEVRLNMISHVNVVNEGE